MNQDNPWVRNYIINGHTLATRTRQRNFMIMRLRGALSFAQHLGLTQNADNYRRIIDEVRSAQILDAGCVK